MTDTPALNPFSPQLSMRRPSLEGLPALNLPAGYILRSYRPGDGVHWERIIGESFDWKDRDGRFDKDMRPDYAFRPERVLFICRGEEPVATASAWFRPMFGKTTGYLHYVGVLPSEWGKALGREVSLACLHRMKEEGRESAVLDTDDFRIAAIKTYLGMGFIPLLKHENQRQRWRDVFENLNRPALIEQYAELLAGPIFELPPERKDADSVDRYEIRRKWHPGRSHRGGRCGGGDVDFMGDESLYKSSGLGTLDVSPKNVHAGDPLSVPLRFCYCAGPDGLPEGAAVHLVIRGQSPLGFHLQTAKPENPGFVKIQGPADCILEPSGLGFHIVKGSLLEGDKVEMTVAPDESRRWNPVAGRREIKAVIAPGPADPKQRLPEPAVIDILPREFHRLEAVVPPTREPSSPVSINITARDCYDNRVPISSPVRIKEGAQVHQAFMVEGRAQASIEVRGSGLVRLSAEIEEPKAQAAANPSLPKDEYHCFIGDMHCHDFLSEAEGYTDAVYQWAREDRALQFVSIVPQSHGWHDNETWTIVKYMNERFLREGEFVTFLGFEWQHTGFGDKVVHFLNGDQPFLPVDDGRYNSAPKLYEALRGSDALIISHHPAYQPGAWCPNTDYDVLETDVDRLVELWSMHGSSEGYDKTDRPLHNFYEPGYVYSALRKGLCIGFMAGSDTHSARPGGSAKEPLRYWGGLAAVWAESLTRRSLFKAIYERRTCALTGARIILQFKVNGAWMGSEIPAAEQAQIKADIWAPGKIAKVELLKNTRVIKQYQPGQDEFHLEYEDKTEGPAYYHCRVTQEDGHLAVCSPVWVG